MLAEQAPCGVQPVGFIPEEFRTALLRGNPLAREAVTLGVVLLGGDFLRRSAEELAGIDAQADATTASASISTSQRGSRRAATTTIVEAGRTSPKSSPCARPTSSQSAARVR